MDGFVFDVEKKDTFMHFAQKLQLMGEVLRRQQWWQKKVLHFNFRGCIFILLFLLSSSLRSRGCVGLSCDAELGLEEAKVAEP